MKMWPNLNCIDFSIIVALSFWEWFLTMMNSRIIRWCLEIKPMARCSLKQWVPDVGMRLGHQECSRNPPAVFNVQSGLSAASGNKAINGAANLLVSAGRIYHMPLSHQMTCSEKLSTGGCKPGYKSLWSFERHFGKCDANSMLPALAHSSHRNWSCIPFFFLEKLLGKYPCSM